MHCHSVASRLTKPEVRKALILPECATEPEAIYELAKRRGMDFVTITDHDTIDGALRLADRPDFFVSEELTARVQGEPRRGPRPVLRDHPGRPRLAQERAGDVEAVAEYLHRARDPWRARASLLGGRGAADPGTGAGLAQLFPVWEVRSGYFGAELNASAIASPRTCGGVGCRLGLPRRDPRRTDLHGDAVAAALRSSSSGMFAAGRAEPRGEQGNRVEARPGNGGDRAAEPSRGARTRGGRACIARPPRPANGRLRRPARGGARAARGRRWAAENESRRTSKPAVKRT